MSVTSVSANIHLILRIILFKYFMIWGLSLSRGCKFFSSPCPDWLWGPSSLLSKGCWSLLPQG